MKKLYPEESVQAIADSIRSKTGKTDKMSVGEMSGEIEGIDLDAAYQSIINQSTLEGIPDRVTTINEYALQGISLLKQRIFPNVTRIDTRGLCNILFMYQKTDFSHIRKNFLDFPKLTYIGYQGLYSYGVTVLHLVLRAPQVCTLYGTNALGGYAPYSTNYFYVPKNLISDYESDEIWKTFVDWDYIFRALEDYTVDGTTTGALDESKI